MKIKNYLTHLLYLILKKDMIRKLKQKHGEQFIDDVMETFNIPTNFMNKYYNTTGRHMYGTIGEVDGTIPLRKCKFNNTTPCYINGRCPYNSRNECQ